MNEEKRAARIGILGGSGLYALDALSGIEERRLRTPYGEPSDAFTIGRLGDADVVFLARHGRGHRILPSEINYRANVWALKALGCDAVISISACGSMKEHLKPTHLVLPDQILDRTRLRESTFFGEGCVAHVSLAHPICPSLVETLHRTAIEAGAPVEKGGTYLCIEGPQFSTRAESLLYRSWNVDVIGMTNATEARLCREAELCYATMNLVTDFDCWNEAEQAVTVDAILDVLRKNAETANRLVLKAAQAIDSARACGCRSALAGAILTRREDVPDATKTRLELLLKRYWI